MAGGNSNDSGENVVKKEVELRSILIKCLLFQAL